MENKIEECQELLRQQAELVARLNLLPYDGTPEIKENKSGKYLYVRKRELGKLTSTYVDKFSDELYETLLRYSREARELRKSLRSVEVKLANLGYMAGELSPIVEKNLEFARINMKSNIYDQAVLEGVATTYPQTETIIDNGKVSGMTATDVQKILNLKHAWEFILEKNVLLSKTDFFMLSYIAKLVNEGFYENGGKIRTVPVRIGGCSFVPPLPIEIDVKETINNLVNSDNQAIDIAINLCLYVMKTQIFNDGNKRTAVIFANHYLISKGAGLIVIPEHEVGEFKKLLVKFYEGENPEIIKNFMRSKCWKKFD